MEAIYTPILWPIIITLLITIISIFNGTSKHMEEEFYIHNHTIRRSYFYIKKTIQVIMTNYNNFHICNFETTWKISNKTRRQSHNLKTQYCYKRKSKYISIINKRQKFKPLIYHTYTSIALKFTSPFFTSKEF